MTDPIYPPDPAVASFTPHWDNARRRYVCVCESVLQYIERITDPAPHKGLIHIYQCELAHSWGHNLGNGRWIPDFSVVTG